MLLSGRDGKLSWKLIGKPRSCGVVGTQRRGTIAAVTLSASKGACVNYGGGGGERRKIFLCEKVEKFGQTPFQVKSFGTIRLKKDWKQTTQECI